MIISQNIIHRVINVARHFLRLETDLLRQKRQNKESEKKVDRYT